MERRMPGFRDILGKSPVAVPLLMIGKIAYLCCALFFLVKVWNIDTMLFDSPAMQAAGVVLYAAGLVAAIVSIVHLGDAAVVGFPERETGLKTRGIYAYSRNPLYVGGFVMCAGSCLFAPHVVNVLLFAVTMAIHMRIVTKEEVFLEQRFGRAWLDYKARVPRYLGIPRRTGRS